LFTETPVTEYDTYLRIRAQILFNTMCSCLSTIWQSCMTLGCKFGVRRSVVLLVCACVCCQGFVLVQAVAKMENPEEVLQSLDEFAKLKPKDIPRELEDYLSYVAKTGDPVYQWSIVKCLFREKLLNVITEFHETSPTIDLPPCPNVDPFNYESMKNSLLERLDSFPSAPFTVQRLCELLTTPRKEYSRADKFMRAVEKNILVVSTREPGNVRRFDNNGQPELLMNGVMDGRGIELGEAIETVSSEGVNLMHSDENEVNVTENENVPVECAGMEEIDMEEQGDRMESANSNWEKEQSEVLVQNEEDGNLNYDGYNGEGENKSKESSECFEVNSTESDESGSESAELPVVAENVVDSISRDISEDSHPVVNVCSPRSKEHLGKMDESSDFKPDDSRDETILIENSAVEGSMTPKETIEETVVNLPPKGTESTSSEQESIENSSPSEDLSKSDSDTETVAAAGDLCEHTDTGSLVSETDSLEPVTSSAETTCATDSESTAIPLEQPGDGCVETDVNAETKTVTEEVTSSNTEQYNPDDISADISENKKLEEVSSSPLAEPEDIAENGGDSKTEKPADEGVVVCNQVEAMEVDDSGGSTHLVSADVVEPMDESEQPTDS